MKSLSHNGMAHEWSWAALSSMSSTPSPVERVPLRLNVERPLPSALPRFSEVELWKNAWPVVVDRGGSRCCRQSTVTDHNVELNLGGKWCAGHFHSPG